VTSTLLSPSPVLEIGFSDESRRPAAKSAMTLPGTLQKSGLLGLVLFFTALVAAQVNLSYGVAILFLPAALVLAISITLKPVRASRLAPLYAVLEGAFVGVLSDWYAATYGGMIVVYAIGMTAAIFLALLIVYASGKIKVSQNFKLVVATATIGIAIYYGVALVLGFFGISAPLIADTNFLGVAFSVFVVLVASANLVIDFDFIEKGIESGAPKYMEWFAAFGLMVSLIWLYLELLRLLAKIMARRND
jgi:uncharacterized YccA/Bax inhibitor family protein